MKCIKLHRVPKGANLVLATDASTTAISGILGYYVDQFDQPVDMLSTVTESGELQNRKIK